MKNNRIRVRQGEAGDIPQLSQLIKELAAYERAAHEAVLSEDRLLYDFLHRKAYRFLVSEYDEQPAGIALYYPKYSTWKGHSLFLEDIIVGESFRRKGLGRALFNEIIRIAHREKAARLEWQVLNWNESAISFYRRFSSSFDDEWINCKLTSEMIENHIQHAGI